MPEKIKIEAIGEKIDLVMQGYQKGAGAAVKKAVRQCAKETNDEIKAHATFRSRSGDYVKAFQLKTVFEDDMNKRIRWQVKPPYYRLTHLLEKGHRIVDVNHRLHGTTKPHPHISYGAALAERRLPELIREEMSRT